jgi:hypothetical protein
MSYINNHNDPVKHGDAEIKRHIDNLDELMKTTGKANAYRCAILQFTAIVMWMAENVGDRATQLMLTASTRLMMDKR